MAVNRVVKAKSVKKSDAEAIAMFVAMEYMNGANERGRERFMFHLAHKYFPKGRFEPKRFDAPVKLTGE